MKFDFSKNPQVESLDSVPEDFRSLYEPSEEEGGGFAIKTHSRVVGALVGMQSALQNSRTGERKAKDSAAAAEAWKALGESPEEVSTRISELQKQLDSAAGNSADIEKLRAEMQKATATQLQGKDEELSIMQKSLESHLIDDSAVRALAKHDASVNLLLPHVRSKTKVIMGEDGKHRVVVLDADGAPRFNGTTGLHMSISELVEEMKASSDFGMAFKPSGTAGSGAPPTPGGRAPQIKQNMSAAEKVAAGMKARNRR